MKDGEGSRALFLELAARGVCVRAGAVPDSLSPDEAGKLLGRVRADRAGLREILAGRGDKDLKAVLGEAGKGGA